MTEKQIHAMIDERVLAFNRQVKRLERGGLTTDAEFYRARIVALRKLEIEMMILAEPIIKT